MSDENPVAEKICSDCKKLLPANNEYFHRDNARKDGLQPFCKACSTERNRAYWQKLNHPDNEEKLAQHQLKQRESNKKYRANNPEKRRASIRDYYQTHSEQIQERNTRYRKANAERVRLRKKRWRDANREAVRENARQWRAAHPELVCEITRRWQAKNPDKVREFRNLRGLRLRAAGDVTKEDLAQLRKIQNGCCAYCGNVLEKGKTHVDHIQPVSRGGRSDRVNLCLACDRCNMQKHDKTPEEWVKRWYE